MGVVELKLIGLGVEGRSRRLVGSEIVTREDKPPSYRRVVLTSVRCDRLALRTLIITVPTRYREQLCLGQADFLRKLKKSSSLVAALSLSAQ